MQPTDAIKLTATALSLMVVAISGCATHATDRYASNPDTALALRQIDAGKVRIDEFRAAGTEMNTINCRLEGTVQPPDGSTFAQYIRNALTDELKLAGLYDESSDVVITGLLREIDFSSVDGSWIISVELHGSQGATLSADELYEFDTSFIAYSACDQAAQSFMPAVQDLIKTITTSPDFANLLRS